MKLRVVLENTVVVVTVLDLSNNIKNKFKKRRSVTLIKQYLDNYIGIELRSKRQSSKKYGDKISVDYSGILLSFNCIGKTDSYRFSDPISAKKFVTNLTNSVTLVNHGTEVEIEVVNHTLNDTEVITLN